MLEVKAANGVKLKAGFCVCDGVSECLLGNETAQLLELVKIYRVSVVTNKSFPKVPNRIVRFKIDENVIPFQSRFCNVPLAKEDEVKEMLMELEKLDIIERVNEPSKWVSPLVVVVKPSGGIRLCVNMK